MNPAKARGTAWESDVVKYVVASGHYPYCERRALRGARDTGDIAGLPIVVECKSCKSISLGTWVAEAEAEARNADLPRHWWAVWHKRRGRASPGDAYVTISGELFVELLMAWDHAPAEDDG